MNMTYLAVTKAVVQWENHKYQSSQDNSLILKNFFFQFLNMYVYLGYLVLFKVQTISELETTFAVLLATSFGSQIGVNGALPYALYIWQTRRISKKWSSFYDNFYKPYFSSKTEKEPTTGAEFQQEGELKVQNLPEDHPQYKVSLLPKHRREEPIEKLAMEYEVSDCKLHKQIEFTLGMKPFASTQDIFMFMVGQINQAAQFGYTALFIAINPYASLLCLGFLVIILWLYVWRMTRFSKRAEPVPANSIGVWYLIFRVNSTYSRGFLILE